MSIAENDRRGVSYSRNRIEREKRQGPAKLVGPFVEKVEMVGIWPRETAIMPRLKYLR